MTETFSSVPDASVILVRMSMSLATGIEAFERMYNDAIKPDNMSVEALKEFSGGKPIGAIRASFGYVNVASDITRFVEVTRKRQAFPGLQL